MNSKKKQLSKETIVGIINRSGIDEKMREKLIDLASFTDGGFEKTVERLKNKDENGVTLLHLAAGFLSNAPMLSNMVGLGADVNAKDNEGLTPLHWAMKYKAWLANVEALIESGADVNAKDNEGRTPLHMAAWHSESVDVVKCLLTNGADLTILDNQNWGPFDYAFKCSEYDEIGLLFMDLFIGKKGEKVTDPILAGKIMALIEQSDGEEIVVDSLD